MNYVNKNDLINRIGNRLDDDFKGNLPQGWCIAILGWYYSEDKEARFMSIGIMERNYREPSKHWFKVYVGNQKRREELETLLYETCKEMSLKTDGYHQQLKSERKLLDGRN